jgi:hypothetical protein
MNYSLPSVIGGRGLSLFNQEHSHAQIPDHGQVEQPQDWANHGDNQPAFNVPVGLPLQGQRLLR